MHKLINAFLEDYRVRRQIRQESKFILKELKKEFRTLENSYRFRNRLSRTYSPKQYLDNFYETFLGILTRYTSMKNYSYKIGRNPKEADYFEVLNYFAYRVNEEAVKHLKAVKYQQPDYIWTLPEEPTPVTLPEKENPGGENIGLLRLVEK
ncbi:MAG: hypothetical protein M0Z31_08630 [Clostridia bacterium]|nr:hypothetical protein [Clostridia bacterium]